MRKTLAVALIALTCLVPSRLFGKGTTTKVLIEGSDLSKPIEITDRHILANFNVWTGPGTFSSQPPIFLTYFQAVGNAAACYGCSQTVSRSCRV